MGLFDLFGGKKNGAEDEASKEQELLSSKEKEIEAARKAHAELTWPTIPRLNPVNIKDAETHEMEETVSPERKSEVGQLIYEPDISIDALVDLSGQELLFLLTAMEVFNKTAPLPDFEKNHRKVYNEILGRLRDSKELYVLYDTSTGYPFIDHGFANVYFEEDLAEKAKGMFEGQYRKLVVRKVKVENEEAPASVRRGFFDYLYYIGIENLIVDNGAYRARFKRNEIVVSPMDWNSEKKDASPVNPELNFAMIDFLEELRWPVQYEKRADVLKAKEVRMLSLIRNANYIIPMQHEGPAEVMEDGRIRMGKDTKLKFLVMKTKDDKQFLPVYTDAIEFSKKLTGTEWNAAVFKYQDILKFVQDKEGIRINPNGQGIVLPKDRMMAIEIAAQQAAIMRGKAGVKPQQSGSAASMSEEAAVQAALNQAMAKMNEKRNTEDFKESEEQ